MTTYLFIWTILAAGGSHTSPHIHAQWVNNGSFKNTVSCNRAAANLGLKPNEYRCINIE